ncbi:MAG: hypothetical protein ACE14W_08440 [Candidatus Velamenicoccus archaeovorus]
MKPRTLLPFALALALVAAACSSGSSPGGGDGGSAAAKHMQAVVASVDLYTAAPQRVAVGLPFADGTLVSFGTVRFAFSYLGTASDATSPQPGPTATATYIPTPGTPGGSGSGPRVTQPAEARGLYEAEGVTFDRAGYWRVRVSADVEGVGTQSADASFQVADRPALPAPGQRALRTDNLTMSSKHVPPGAIDSRAASGGSVPDPELHRWTIARAIAEHRPALVVFATPVYCISRFCGPVTDAVEQLAARYGDRAVFIHVEIWHDFQKQEINQAAADWLYRNGDLTEPWLYLIGADGRILDRWSSLFGTQEVAHDLQQLPVMKG